MPEEKIGERIAALEATVGGFMKETVATNKYIRDKLDDIASSLPNKVDRPYCQDRHEKLDGTLREIEKDGKHDKLTVRVEKLEQKAPAIVQYIVLIFATGTVMSIVSYVIGKL